MPQILACASKLSPPFVWLGKKPGILLVAMVLSISFSGNVEAQFGPPGGPGGGPGGGPNSADKKIAKEFDADQNGFLDAAERAKARESLKQNNRGGRGGGRGPRGRGGSRPKGTPGPKVSPSDVTPDLKSGLYDIKALRTIFLEFENEDWEQELADFKPTDVEVPAKMIVDGKTYENVGVSFRGASSFFMIPAGSKRSLNISMDLVNQDQKLYGYKSLNLLNGNGDAAMMSSALYSSIASSRIPTPKVNFMRVVINGQSWGIYSNAQQFNKDFLKEHYDTRKGNRWKVNGSPRGDGGLRYLGDDIEKYRTRFEIKSKDTEQAWKNLIQLCKVLNETPADQLEEALAPLLDIEGTLWFLAVDVATMNSDGYWTRASDYSIYQGEDGIFRILPHDMNEAFRASRGRRGGGRRGGPPQGGGRPPQGGGRPPQGGPPQGGPPQGSGQADGSYDLDPMINSTSDRFPLRSKLLANEKFKTLYLQFLREIASEHLAWKHFGPRVETMRNLIAKEVKADTRKLMTEEAFELATDSSSPAKPRSLKEFAEKRSEFLLHHPAIKNLPAKKVEIVKPATGSSSGSKSSIR